MQTMNSMAVTISDAFDVSNYSQMVTFGPLSEIGMLKMQLPFMEQYFETLGSHIVSLETHYEHSGIPQITFARDDIISRIFDVVRFRGGNVYIGLQYAAGTQKWRLFAVCTIIHREYKSTNYDPINNWDCIAKRFIEQRSLILHDETINDTTDYKYFTMKYLHKKFVK